MCDYEEDTVLEVGKTYVFKSEQAKVAWLNSDELNKDILRQSYKEGFTLAKINVFGDGEVDKDICIDIKEIKYFKLKEDMSVDKPVEFTKSMLKDGMVVMLRNQDDNYAAGRYLILSNSLTTISGSIPLTDYSEMLFDNDESDFDIMAVYSVDYLGDLDIDNWELSLLWERKEISPEVLANQKKIEEIQSTIDTLNSQLEQLRKL